MYQVPGALYLVFDSEISIPLGGVDSGLLVGGLPVLLAAGPQGAFQEATGPAGPLDVWSVAPGPDALIETAPGVPAVFAAQGGTVFLLN